VVLAKEAGLFGDEVEAAQDSSPVVGRGAVQDTYNLLGTSIRKLVRAIAKEQGEPARVVATRYGVEDLFDRSTKATADIDWTDREAKRRFLQRLVETAKRLVEQVDPREPWGVAPSVREAVAIVQKVLVQDIEVGADGRVSLRQGVAEDRLISVHDPEMRRGHKTQSEAFEGYKFHITVEVEHGFVLATEVTGANVHDSEPSNRMAERAEEASGSVLTKVIGDCAYGTEKNRAAHAETGRTLVAKIPKAAQGALLGKEHFDIDLDQGTVTCPHGISTSTSEVVRARNAEPGKERLTAEERSKLFVFPPGGVWELSAARHVRVVKAGVQDRGGRAVRAPLPRRAPVRQDRSLSGRP
jgi:transposase